MRLCLEIENDECIIMCSFSGFKAPSEYHLVQENIRDNLI